MQNKHTVDLNARAREQRGTANVATGVTDSTALGYAAGIQARRGLPKYTAAVAGGEGPHMPALEQPHQTGVTMAAQAESTRRNDAVRHATVAAVTNSGAGSIISRDVQQAAPVAPDRVASPQDLVLLPQDLLPAEAAKDPMYQQGAGSRMALSQPHMAAKYGVIRAGRAVSPQELVRGAAFQAPPGQQSTQRKMRPMADVAADLQKAMTAPAGGTRAARGEEEEDEGGVEPPSYLPRTDEEAVAQAKANVAARAGAAPVPSALNPNNTDRMGLTDDDLASLQQEMIRDILRDPGQKEAVEARCKPLNIEELIMSNTVQQRVPILAGTFEPTFESMRGDVELALKRLLVAESRSITVTESYLLDKYAVMTTAAGLVKINDMPVPTLFDNKGEFNDDLFWAKFNWVLKRPIHMLASLGIHYSWFEQRVRKLFKASEGKDG